MSLENQETKIGNRLVLSLEQLVPGLKTDGLIQNEELESDKPINLDSVCAGTDFDLRSLIGGEFLRQPRTRQYYDFKTIPELIRKLLPPGEIVVDLGSGTNMTPYAFSCRAGAAGYIAVDINYAKSMYGRLSERTRTGRLEYDTNLPASHDDQNHNQDEKK